MAKDIRITCKTELSLDCGQLNWTQGKLKELSVEDFGKVWGLLLSDGFNFAIHVWKELSVVKGKEVVKWWIIDGHARVAVVRKMVEQGFSCPALPCVEIEAVSLKDAKRKVLAASSSFHKMTRDGLYEFMHDADVSMDELVKYELFDIEMDSFEAEYFTDDEEVEAPKDKAPSVLECPSCKAHFTSSEAKKIKAAAP